MADVHLKTNFEEQDPIRAGFGRGLLDAGKRWENIVGVCADLTESTKMNLFAEAFPERFIQAGVAEQNIVTVGSGLAAMGKIPFVSSDGTRQAAKLHAPGTRKNTCYYYRAHTF
jgi:transketolase C-terminal domain/subunit